MKRILLTAAAAMIALSASQAEAAFVAQPIDSPSLVEQAACSVRRVRIQRPNGTVAFRTVRRCGPGVRPSYERCRVVRERVRRPNGNVVLRTVRRCGY